jgi:hypothetical protein
MRIFGRIFADLRYAVRSLRRRPSFTVVAIISLAVALGANTAVFFFTPAIVIKTLPVAGADRLVIPRQHNEMFHMENCCFTRRFFEELRRQDLGFEGVLAAALWVATRRRHDGHCGCCRPGRDRADPGVARGARRSHGRVAMGVKDDGSRASTLTATRRPGKS